MKIKFEIKRGFSCVDCKRKKPLAFVNVAANHQKLICKDCMKKYGYRC